MQEMNSQKREVPSQFDGVARRYDLLTTMNPGYTKHLRWSAQRLGLAPKARILDLCCGTGLSTKALVERYPDADITALDASAGMLEQARKKPFGDKVKWLLGDAMDPAASGADGPFDGILMAYGIRNMPDADLCLARLYELLAPGGTLCFHEYSVADSRLSQIVWNAVAFGVIIPAGLLSSPRSGIYRYLRRSVNDFDGVGAFEARLACEGFEQVRTEPMDGWQRGIVHSFLARRPA